MSYKNKGSLMLTKLAVGFGKEVSLLINEIHPKNGSSVSTVENSAI